MSNARTQDFYDGFYAAGGWEYKFVREWWWHRRQLVKRFGLRRGQRMLEIACGMGFHTNLFCRMGFNCAGLDSNATAVRLARQAYPGREYHLADVRGDLPYAESSFDVMVTRGCSLYHYDLMSKRALDTTANLLCYLKPGGLFVLMIASDLSNRREPGQIWQNRLQDYREHFERFGGTLTVAWHKGMVICGLRKRG